MKAPRVRLLCVAALWLLAGCGDAWNGAPKPIAGECRLPHGAPRDAIEGGWPLYDGPPISLCALAHSSNVDSGGLYEVSGIVERKERALDEDERREQSVFYTKLDLLDAWMRAKDCIVVRNASAAGAFRVGDHIGVFIGRAADWNGGFPFLGSQGTFTRGADGGYSNSGITELDDPPVSEAELGERVHALAEAPATEVCAGEASPAGDTDSGVENPGDAGARP